MSGPVFLFQWKLNQHHSRHFTGTLNLNKDMDIWNTKQTQTMRYTLNIDIRTGKAAVIAYITGLEHAANISNHLTKCHLQM